MINMAYSLSTFGSRFSLIFDTHNKNIQHGVLGMFMERTSALICGVEDISFEQAVTTDKKNYINKSDDKKQNRSFLPLCGLENNFMAVYQSASPNSVTFHGVNKNSGYDLFLTITSPFVPQDEKLMCAPFFYVDIKVKRKTRPHNLVLPKKLITEGNLVFGVKGEGLDTAHKANGIKLKYDIDTTSNFILGDFNRTLKVDIIKDGLRQDIVNNEECIYSMQDASISDGLFNVPFSLSDDCDEVSFSFVWAAFYDDYFININNEKYQLLYNKYFTNLDGVINYAKESFEEIREKSAFFDAAIVDSSLSQNWKDFIAFTFQSYKLNTLYAVNAAGKKSFTVWEGNCMYNATLDVEYNNGLFYYTMCPQLLPTLFEQWAATEQGRGYIAHDLGGGYNMGDATYGYPMKIEENCNFILMLYSYCAMTGEFEQVRKHYDTLKSLTKFILNSDTTGNGIPNEGTDNTIDDAVPAIQNAKEQTYLAVKSACTLQCFAKAARAMDDAAMEKICIERAEKIMKTVDESLWHEDHYGVCLDEYQDGYRAFLTHEKLSGKMQGKDSYHIYAQNGILYPMLSGFAPEYVDYARMKTDILNAHKKCDTMFGCNHSNDSDSVWISQNLWRDFSAAYLGIDMLDNVDKYWEMQKIFNTNGRINLFIDTFGENALWYYPRGLTSIGVLYAMLRLKVDGVKKIISISPIRQNMRIPLTMFADWDKCEMPWVHVQYGQTKIENEHLLKGFEIIISGDKDD